jgi:uncharacterized membrane protein
MVMNDTERIINSIENNETENSMTINDSMILLNEKTKNNESPKFAQGMCYFKLFWMFLIGCIVGTYYEQIVTLIRNGVWESRQGVIYGPFNPVYGFGMALIVLTMYKIKEWWKIFTLGAILGGGVEYLLSYLQEYFIDSRSWDYSNHLLKLNGRTTIPFMIFWGILATFIIKLVYPILSSWIECMPVGFSKVISILLSIFLGIDMLITGTVLLRQGQRLQGNEASTVVGEIIDQVYSDEYLAKIFPNMSKNYNDIEE